MKKVFSINLLAILSLFIFTSCEDDFGDSTMWGTSQIFDNFMGYNYEPVIMEQTLELEFNEDAQAFLNNDIIFEIHEEIDGKMTRAENIQVYKDSVKCADNLLAINKKDRVVNLGIEFLPSALEGAHKYYLKPVKSDLDRIDAIELEKGFYAKKIDIANPLAKWLLIGTIVILVILLAWIIIVRMFINPRLKFNRVIFDYGNGQVIVRTNGAYQLVCTNRSIKESALKKLFVGKTAVEVNEMWERQVTIKCGRRNSLRIIGSGAYTIDTLKQVRREPFTMTNSSDKEVKIQTT